MTTAFYAQSSPFQNKPGSANSEPYYVCPDSTLTRGTSEEIVCGQRAMLKVIYDNLQYPDTSFVTKPNNTHKTSGTAVVTFVIQAD